MHTSCTLCCFVEVWLNNMALHAGSNRSMMCLFIVFVVLVSSCVSGQHEPLIVDINFGRVAGRYIDDVAVFTSIPYAANVDKENRWKDPKFPFPIPGIWDATSVAPGCPQECDLPSPHYTCPQKQDENCLFLNIYAPKNATGFSGSLLYDGRFLVNKTNIILVTVNYRLHALGYLVYGTGDRAITGNLGLKDQILSLRWVKSNIEGFGGDPNRVTISGQSAGAISSSVIMGSLQASGLFKQAIIQSNPVGIPIKSMNDAIKLGKDFAKALGCGTENDYDCLYSKNYTEITTAAMAVSTKVVDYHQYICYNSCLLELFVQWTPVVDGIEVLGQPLNLFEKGQYPDIPFMIGTTAQEGELFVHEAFTSELKKTEYESLLALSGPKYYRIISDMYPPSSGDNRDQAAMLSTDRAFYCPVRRAAQVYSNQTLSLHDAHVYQYVFNHSWSFGDGWKPDFLFCKPFSCHAAELPFLFGTISLGGYSFTDQETQLSDSMMRYWGNFVTFGTPNGDKFTNSTLRWPEYWSYDGWNSMRFKTPKNEIVKDYRKDKCDVWDEMGYNL